MTFPLVPGSCGFGLLGDYDAAADLGVLAEGIEKSLSERVRIHASPAKEGNMRNQLVVALAALCLAYPSAVWGKVQIK